ncbi:MAG TPA: DUF5715 family protein [Spirochaetota bacterium]|nr:hypothetical protein [Spirochaetota bacterium]HOD15679.1 DUF5715 family protein [Spirochaetota bacterium]HPG50416.1 DUF5715 family protein [Spirochaetota bacterium]HQL83981.1 DUF5715 family protein [Spirochaetota bacterium]
MKNESRAIVMKKIMIPCVIAILFFLAGIFSCSMYLKKTVVRDVSTYLDAAHAMERGFIEKIPLYDDYSNPVIEQKLRTYLNPAHLDAAAKYGLPPLSRDSDIQELVRDERLVRIEAKPESLFYFYNVRDTYRALTPGAREGLDLLTGRLQSNFQRYAKLPPVKIAISSMMRPESYQDGLRETNANATMTTTHSSGISFDIYFDDYYVVLPQPAGSNSISDAVLVPVRTRMGFLMGDALRGQLRSVLTETLIQLQDEGALYAILEKRQRCYHVTILGRDKPGR